MKKNIVRNIILCFVLAFFAVVINVKGVNAAKEKNQYVYSETSGNFVFEMNTRYFMSGKSHVELDLRVFAKTDSELLTSLRVEATNTATKHVATINGSTDEVIIEDFTMRVYSNKENSITFFYKTTLDSVESDKSITLKLDAYAPSFKDVSASNSKPCKTIVADLELLEVSGLRKIEYLLVNEGETTIGKSWVTFKNYEHANVYNNIIEQIEIKGLSDGKYDLYVKAVDYAGNESEVVTVGTYTVDNTAPIFTTDVTTSADWTNNPQVTLPVTTSTTDKLTYTINGGAAVEYTEDTKVITLTTEGEVKIVVTAVDAAGNTATKEFTVKLDSVKPEVNAVVTGGDVATGTGYTITITGTDATSGIAKIFYMIDGGDKKEYTAPFELPLSEDAYEIAYYAVDNAGNETDVKLVETGSVDSLGVTVTLEKVLLSGIPFTSADLAIRVNVTTSVGILSVKYSNEKTPDVWEEVDLRRMAFDVSANGKYTVKVETVVGTTAQETVTVTEIDKVNPVLENLLVKMNKNHGVVTFDYSDDYSGILSIGVLICEAASTDCELGGDHEPDFYKMIMVVEDASTVDLSDLAHPEKVIVVEFKDITNVEFDIEDDGAYNVQVMVMDNATNTSVILNQDIISDGTAPTAANISRNIQDEVSKEDYVYTITGKATDALSGMKAEFVKVYKFDANGNKNDPAAITDLSNPITISEEGKYEFYYCAEDNSGNKTEVKEIFIIDRTGPDFSLVFNVAEKTWTNKLEMEIKANNLVDAETVDTIRWGYALEGNAIALTESLEEFQKLQLDLATGKYVFKVEVTDKCGNVTVVDSGVYYVDIINPTLTVNTALNNKIFGGATEVNVSLSDADSGINKVSYIVYKGGEKISESASVDAIASYSFTVPYAEEGHYSIEVKLTDKAGNLVSAESEEFLVDLKAPVIGGLNETGYHTTGVRVTISDITNVETMLNGEEVLGEEFEITQSGYYQLSSIDELGQKTTVLFVVNLRNELVLKDKTIDVLTQRYLPIVKDGDDYYINIPKGAYGLKNVLVITSQKDGVQAKIDQDENYIYLKSNVNKAVVENGYRVKVTDKSIITDEDVNGYYGYVVVSAVTTEEALDMDIEVVVIDNEGLALGLGIAGTVALVGLFFVSRGKKSLKV